MKRFFQALAIVLCLSMFTPSIMPIVGIETVKASIKTPKLSKSKVEIAQGSSASIKLNNASSKSVKWSSSNKSVATVNKGKIKGVAPGKATITAKYKDKSYKCKVTIKKFGLEYINSEIIAKTPEGYNIIKYTNNTECNIGLIIKTEHYDNNGYHESDSTEKILCAKGESIYSSFKTSDKQIIKIHAVTKYKELPEDFIDKYEIAVDDNYGHNMFKCYLNNTTSEGITCRVFIIFYDNNGEIVETKYFKSIGVDQDEKTMRIYSVDENVVKAEVFVNYVYYDFLYD